MGLPTAFLSRGRPLKGPFYLRLSFLATRKRVHELLKAQLIGNLVLLQLIFSVPQLPPKGKVFASVLRPCYNGYTTLGKELKRHAH